MTTLSIWQEDDPFATLFRSEDREEISAELAKTKVRFDRWQVARGLGADASPEEILAAYEAEVARVVATNGYVLVDVAALRRGDESDGDWAAKATAARQRFLAEHTHDDDEDRFFVSGAGIFYLHLEGRVMAVLCTAGDLLSVPKGTRHWFDMGTDPSFVAIRFFHTDDGWVGNFTGSEIAGRFPDFDALAGRLLTS